MKKQNLILSLVAVAVISTILLIGYSNSISGNLSDAKAHELGYKMNVPDSAIIVHKGSSVTVPVEVLMMNDYDKDLKIIVSEAYYYPKAPKDVELVYFSNGLDAHVNKDVIKSNTKPGKEFSIIDTVNVTIDVGENVKIGKKVLSITLKSDSGRSLQHYLHLNIINVS